MDLLIDTTQKGILKLELQDGGRAAVRLEKKTYKFSEEILSELKRFLWRNDIQLEDLEKILVNPGPGAFSSTRTGVATANALALALNITLAEWPSGKIKEMVVPKYDREPNITSPSTRRFASRSGNK